MTHETSLKTQAVSGPKITLVMLLCGMTGALASAAAGAAPNLTDGPGFSIKYSPESLSTESGVRALYNRIVSAAESVCPIPTGTRLISPSVSECRAKAIAQVVHQINNPRLAALLADNSKSG